MGQLWTAEMQQRLDQPQAGAEATSPAPPTAITGETLLVRDVLRGLALHVVDVMRHRLLRRGPPLWALAERIDQARFGRELAEPADPELAKRLEEDLDIFDSIDCFHA